MSGVLKVRQKILFELGPGLYALGGVVGSEAGIVVHWLSLSSVLHQGSVRKKVSSRLGDVDMTCVGMPLR